MESNVFGPAALLTLQEIAAWQVAYPPAKRGKIVAALPALQRGAVWNVKQIEDLWDSLLRRFPIGSFVITQPDNRLKQKDYKLPPGAEMAQDHTHLLLDGQQRATGIALGFFDIWQHPIAEAPSALWLDLAAPPENSDSAHVFRVVTRSHPWGYKRTNPSDTLAASQIRAALWAFQNVNDGMGSARPAEFTLTQTWPWDAEAPVPVALLIEAVVAFPGDLQGARTHAWTRVKRLPMLLGTIDDSSSEDAGKVENDARIGLKRQRAGVHEAFSRDDSQLSASLDNALTRLGGLIAPETNCLVPALPLTLAEVPEKPNPGEIGHGTLSPAGDTPARDPIELLFVRINSAGEPLGGEELTYSLLKAAWPDAAKFIDNLKHKPAQASRIATLCTRLILARQQIPTDGQKRPSMPSIPGINEFRRLVRDQNPAHPNFYSDLTKFIEQDADVLFTETWKFLTEREFALLPVLAVDLARKASDVYFLLLRWMDRLRDVGVTDKISETIHRRTLGFLTALAWFAPDRARSCSAIWAELQAETEPNRIINYFNKKRFSEACRLDNRLNMRMVPLPSVDDLKLACDRGVTGHKGCTKTISSSDSAIWTAWDWYEFTDFLVKDSEARNRWAKVLMPQEHAEDEEKPDLSALTLQAVRYFLDTLYDSRSVLLYAQRKWLRTWYPDFDPSQPDFMEDKDRPWDYDHILPQSFLRGSNGGVLHNLPSVIRDWVLSIGNLRAWPLEANRSDSDTSPSQKLSEVSQEEDRYGMRVASEIRSASFVEETKQWSKWEKSVPIGNDNRVEQRRYLVMGEYRDYHKAVVMAIVMRFVALYGEWYQELEIDKLQ
ncbi:DUF262 domain-containing protein [Thiocapsa rosea]|uniref:Uncharacterized protein DUF1524 n=1 Tax=Thiocapsa rosea TaxID=69360 RepID=A0A495UPB9_9GAMM|nr:DUF262 domain-containing protein [Thiocapsa rosea]RKT38055.1 uncharacterized protein DUF1524 [Thiocapsa rosea]